MRSSGFHCQRPLLFLVCALVWVLSPFGLNKSVRAQQPCSTPPSNNQWWAPNTQITVWIDPSFMQQASFHEKQSIQYAFGEWAGELALANNAARRPSSAAPLLLPWAKLRIIR